MSVYSDADNAIKFAKPRCVYSVSIDHNFSYSDYDDDCGFDVSVTLKSDAYEDYGVSEVDGMLRDYKYEIERILRYRSTSDCTLTLDSFNVVDDDWD